MATDTYQGFCPVEVRQANVDLDSLLRRRFGMTLHIWKLVKAVTDLLALGIVAYGIAEGADPTLSVIIAGAIVLGWEIVEAVAVREEVRDRLRDVSADDGERP